jgi:hypothetical protein
MKTGPERYEFSGLGKQKINYPLQINIKKKAAEPQRDTSPSIPSVGTFGLVCALSPSQKKLQHTDFIISTTKHQRLSYTYDTASNR